MSEVWAPQLPPVRREPRVLVIRDPVTMARVANRLRAQKKVTGLSIPTIARKAKVSISAVQTVLHARKPYTRHLLEKIAGAFGGAATWLLRD